jgi:hypothetical protein
MDNYRSIGAYSVVTLLQLVQHTDELSFVSLPVLKCCGNPGTGTNFSSDIESQMNF